MGYANIKHAVEHRPFHGKFDIKWDIGVVMGLECKSTIGPNTYHGSR